MSKIKLFSERGGHKPRKPVQRKSMDKDLRNRLYNTLCSLIVPDGELLSLLSFQIWQDVLKQKASPYPSNPIDMYPLIFDHGDWYEVFDVIEFSINFIGDYFPGPARNLVDFKKKVNEVLEEENSAYRIVGSVVVEDVTSEEDIQVIEKAQEVPYSGVKAHLHKALKYLHRDNSDYQNSVKESICAIEALAREVTGKPKATLGDLTDDMNLHPAFARALNNLYGYTSDAGGLRHGSVDHANVTPGDALFILVTCSAFVNYIIARNQPK